MQPIYYSHEEDIMEFMQSKFKSSDNILFYGNKKEIKKHLLTTFLMQALNETNLPIFVAVNDFEFERSFFALHKMIRFQSHKRFIIQDTITSEKQNYSYVINGQDLRFDHNIVAINVIDIDFISENKVLSALLNTNSLNIILADTNDQLLTKHHLLHKDIFDKKFLVTLMSENGAYVVKTADNKRVAYTFDATCTYYNLVEKNVTKVDSSRQKQVEFNFDRAEDFKKRYMTMYKRKGVEHLLLERELNFAIIEETMTHGVDAEFINYQPFVTTSYKIKKMEVK